LTPAKHWADFSQTADLKEELIGKKNPAADSRPPYVLVYSRLQEDFSRTGDLPEQVKTDFISATYADMYVFIKKIPKDMKNSVGIDRSLFMVLDKKSEEDRKVVLISQGLASLYVDEENENEVTDNGMGEIIWRKHRIPFEKASYFWLVLASKPGDEGDEFLQNTTTGTADGL
jgi:hypothetical protein